MNKYIIILLSVVGVILFGTTFVTADSQSKLNDKFVDDSKVKFIENAKQITFVGSRSGEGYFSADGSKMIYQSERDEANPFYQMYLLDFKTGKSSRISTGSGMTTCGWIHPSNKKVMWSSTHLDPQFKAKVKKELEERAQPVKKRYSWSYDDQYEIFESDLNGAKIKKLTKALGYDAEGSYSPDGKYIAFASNRSQYEKNGYTEEDKKIIEKDASYAMEIYIMNSDGTNVKRLTTSKGYDGGPFFNADGSKITWRRFTPDGNRADIFTMNADGTDQRQVTKLDVMSWAPFFHPSGRYIIFTTSALGYANFELFIVEATGNGKPIRVTFEDGFDGLPTFSPDGRKISWTRRNEKGESQIYLADWNHEVALKLVEDNQFVKQLNLNLSTAISEEDGRQIVKYLASDDLKGRMTGSIEEKIYTDQIAKLFKSWGLEPAIGDSFIHTFEFVSSVSASPENNKFEFKGRFEKVLKLGQDYQVLSFSKSGDFNAAPMVFAGYGIKAPAMDKWPAYDSYGDTDVKGKWVVLLDFLPAPKEKEHKQHLVSFSHTHHKVTVAKNLGAYGVIIVSDVGLKGIKFDGSLAETSLPVVKISTDVFSQLLKKSDLPGKNFAELDGKYGAMELTTGFSLNSQYAGASVQLLHNKSVGHNVIGKVSLGKSSKTKGLIIGAHGDHLGTGTGSSLARKDEQGQYHVGADDNASGVAGVMELAHYYSNPKNKAELKKPLVFGIWSGEEFGVIGSNIFVKDWQEKNKKKFFESFEASLNMDMIGRLRDKLQVHGVGSAKQWTGLSEEVSLLRGMPVTLTSDPYLPTDAITFYLAEIPSISYTTGYHEEYHTPRDTPDTINYNGLAKVIDIVQSYIDKLATVKSQMVNYEKVAGGPNKRLEGRSFRIYLGTIPDYSQEGVKGVRISGATKDSPADKAGLQKNDIIVEFDSLKIENLYDYVYALQSAKPDKNIKLSVLRMGKKLDLDIIPILKDK